MTTRSCKIMVILWHFPRIPLTRQHKVGTIDNSRSRLGTRKGENNSPYLSNYNVQVRRQDHVGDLICYLPLTPFSPEKHPMVSDLCLLWRLLSLENSPSHNRKRHRRKSGKWKQCYGMQDGMSKLPEMSHFRHKSDSS